MSQAFVIMQIGNKELDEIFQKAIVPAFLSSGLSVKRVDKHNKGGLLKSEIINFIQESDIIIADLTNERPNCYLEVGFAMGIDKFRNLILTVREDHFPDNPKYKKGGPKVHFDLAGYDILSWSPDDIDSFRESLEKRINRRLLIISPSEKPVESVWDQKWIEKHREKALSGLSQLNLKGLMEIRFSISPPKLNKSQRELDEAARSSEIHTFGWPIGVYLYNVPESKPHPTTEGIIAEIKTETYDYWSINKNGDFYSLISLFEDYRNKSDNIFFDTRLVRITEALLYCAKLYSFFSIEPNKRIFFSIRHSGIENRTLIAANSFRRIREGYKSIENEIDTTIEFKLNQIESELVELVKKISGPLFNLFDFFQLADSVYEEIVNNFVKGQI
jgi:hypothetical protein